MYWRTLSPPFACPGKLPKPVISCHAEEKPQVMEAIWDNPNRHADELQALAWHGEVVAARDDAVHRADEQLEDWVTAREKIENDIL